MILKQMKVGTWSVALFATLTLGSVWARAGELPADYLSLPAQQKQDLLWDQIAEAPYDALPTAAPEYFWSMKMLWNLRSPSFLVQTFTNISDEMPKEGRLRYIHTYGTAAKVDFIADPSSPFSGIFQTGAPGILRMSLGTLRENPEKDSFMPGLALKLLIDGKASENFVAIYSLDGQGLNTNFFANRFSTKLAEPTSAALKFIGKAFAQALQLLRPQIRPENELTLPADRVAHTRADGQVESASNVQFPYEVIFQPTDEVQNRMDPNDRKTDFRDSLAQIEPGTKLYKVYGRKTAGDTDLALIGEVVLRSQFVASPYVDQKLFFQHLTRWAE